MMPNSDPESQKSQKVGEDKFAKLWAKRTERLYTVSQKFCYSPFIFVIVLYTVLFKDHISFLVISFENGK